MQSVLLLLIGEHFIQGYLFYNPTLFNPTLAFDRSSFHMSNIMWTAPDEEVRFLF